MRFANGKELTKKQWALLILATIVIIDRIDNWELAKKILYLVAVFITALRGLSEYVTSRMIGLTLLVLILYTLFSIRSYLRAIYQHIRRVDIRQDSQEM